MNQPEYYLNRPPSIRLSRQRRNSTINIIRGIFLDENGNESPFGINLKIIELDIEVIGR